MISFWYWWIHWAHAFSKSWLSVILTKPDERTNNIMTVALSDVSAAQFSIIWIKSLTRSSMGKWTLLWRACPIDLIAPTCQLDRKRSTPRFVGRCGSDKSTPPPVYSICPPVNSSPVSVQSRQLLPTLTSDQHSRSSRNLALIDKRRIEPWDERPACR